MTIPEANLKVLKSPETRSESLQVFAITPGKELVSMNVNEISIAEAEFPAQVKTLPHKERLLGRLHQGGHDDYMVSGTDIKATVEGETVYDKHIPEKAALKGLRVRLAQRRAAKQIRKALERYANGSKPHFDALPVEIKDASTRMYF